MADIQGGVYLMRILLLDIETAPNKVYAWGLWDQHIGTNQVMETSYILCWSAKWYDESKVMFDSVKKSTPKQMLWRMHRLLHEADVVVHYNGLKFDIPTLNKEFIAFGYPPPAPYRQVDCLREVKRMFRFQSNKLDFVSQALALGSKASHEGFELWVKCMDKKDPDHEGAWKRMERYNRQDVKLLETLYTRLRPWIERHPNVATHEDIMGCPKCGSQKYQHQGYRTTALGKYPRYQCQSCAGWFRGNKTVSPRRGEKAVNIV